MSPKRGIIVTLRSFPRAFWVLFLGTFLNKFGTFVIPFLALYLTRRGFTATDAGLALGAYGLGQILACFFGGWMADTFGRRNTIVLSMFSGGAFMLLLSQSSSFAGIVFMTFFTAFTSELYRPASSALLADLIPEEDRVIGYAAYRLAFNAGWAFGPATAGFLSQTSFKWLFVGDAATSWIFGCVALFALPQAARRKQTDGEWSEAWNLIKYNKPFLQLLLASAIIAFAFFQMSTTFGLQVKARGFSDATYGQLISYNGVLVVCFEMMLTQFLAAYNPRRIMAIGYLMVGLGFCLNIWAESVGAFVVAMTIFTIGEMMSMPLGAAWVSKQAPPHLRGRLLGTFSLTWSAMLVFSPGVGMKLFSIHPAVLWGACGVCGVLAAIVISMPTRLRNGPGLEYWSKE